MMQGAHLSVAVPARHVEGQRMSTNRVQFGFRMTSSPEFQNGRENGLSLNTKTQALTKGLECLSVGLVLGRTDLRHEANSARKCDQAIQKLRSRKGWPRLINPLFLYPVLLPLETNPLDLSKRWEAVGVQVWKELSLDYTFLKIRTMLIHLLFLNLPMNISPDRVSKATNGHWRSSFESAGVNSDEGIMIGSQEDLNDLLQADLRGICEKYGLSFNGTATELKSVLLAGHAERKFTNGDQAYGIVEEA